MRPEFVKNILDWNGPVSLWKIGPSYILIVSINQKLRFQDKIHKETIAYHSNENGEIIDPIEILSKLQLEDHESFVKRVTLD